MAENSKIKKGRSSATAEDKKCKKKLLSEASGPFFLIPSWRIDTLRIKKYDDGTRTTTPEFTERQ